MIKDNLSPLRLYSRRLILNYPKLACSSRSLYSTQTSAKDSDSKSSWGTGWKKWTVTIAALGAGYAIGTYNYNHFGPKPTPQEIEHELENIPEYRFIYHHPYVQALREELVENEKTKKLQNKWKEERYYDAIPLLHKGHMVTSSLLKGNGALTVEPLIFQDTDQGELVVFYHVGDRVDGHHGIVHGGFLATLIDEGLTRCGFPSLPHKYGVTASLEMNYRAPTPSNSYIVLKGKVQDVKGRRVITKGTLETLPNYHIDEKTGKSVVDNKPTTLVEGNMVLVEPKWAKYFLWMI